MIAKWPGRDYFKGLMWCRCQNRIALASLLLGTLFLSAYPLGAVTIMPVNLEYMTQEADRIFRAQVTQVEDRFDEKGLWSQFISFQILEIYKGELGDSLTIKQVNLAPAPTQDTRETRSLLAGVMPQYRVGEEVVVFLSPDSEIGFTTTIGLMQGTFKVSIDTSGQKLIVNEMQNTGLLEGMSALELAESYGPEGLSSVRFQELKRRPAAMELQNMKALIKDLLAD